MTTDLTLPGDIPGLLRAGSPVWFRDEETPWVVTWVGPWPDSDSVEDGAIALIAPAAAPCIGMDVNGCDLYLRLDDPTGRAHAAWWAWSQGPPEHEDPGQWGDLLRGCAAGRGDAERLRRGVLALAGRTP